MRLLATLLMTVAALAIAVAGADLAHAHPQNGSGLLLDTVSILLLCVVVAMLAGR